MKNYLILETQDRGCFRSKVLSKKLKNVKLCVLIVIELERIIEQNVFNIPVTLLSQDNGVMVLNGMPLRVAKGR